MIAGQVKDNRLEKKPSQRVEEIVHFKKKLEKFNIKLYELSNLTPGCSRTRTKAISVARQLAQDLKIIESIKSEESFPQEKLQVIQKLFPLHLPYIIAMIVLFVEEYTTLTAFLNMVE